MRDIEFQSPPTLEDLCQLLAERKGTIIAGGTDLIPKMQRMGVSNPFLVDLSRIPQLRFLESNQKKIRIGSLITFNEIARSEIVQRGAHLLADAARTVGSEQIRNRGTLGGNVANASPAGDSLPPLLVLDAELILLSKFGERIVPLSRMLLGPGETAIAENEVIHSICINQLDNDTRSCFLRLGNRQGKSIAVVSVAIALKLDGQGCIEDLRLALGAVAPTAMRCVNIENEFIGEQISIELIGEVAEKASRDCSPIDDVRGTANYRRHVVKQYVARGLRAAAGIDGSGV